MPIYHNEQTIFGASVRLGMTEVYISFRLRFSSIHFQNSETFSTTDKALTTCEKIATDPAIGRREGATDNDTVNQHNRRQLMRRMIRPLLERRPILGHYSYKRLMAKLREKRYTCFQESFVRMGSNIYFGNFYSDWALQIPRRYMV